jgi:hypothetical protein
LNTITAGRFAGLGGFTGPMKIPLSRSTVLLFSLPGKGKSSLLQTHAGAYIINADCSSTVTPKPLATLWPGVDQKTGQLINDDGRPFILTLDDVHKKRDKLLELARNDQPRPDTVGIDSITTFATLARNYVVKNATSLGISKTPVNSFRELHGPAAWDCAYEQVVSFITDLRNAGYGVTILAHIVKEKIPLGEDKFAMGVDFTFGSGLWKRISPLVDYSCLIDQVTEAQPFPTTQKVPVGGGKFIDKEVIEYRNANAVYIDCLAPEYPGLVKTRSTFPRFKLPAIDAWAALEEHHLKHST